MVFMSSPATSVCSWEDIGADSGDEWEIVSAGLTTPEPTLNDVYMEITNDMNMSSNDDLVDIYDHSDIVDDSPSYSHLTASGWSTSRLGPNAQAALGCDLRNTGRGCGLAIIVAHDITFEPRRKEGKRNKSTQGSIAPRKFSRSGRLDATIVARCPQAITKASPVPSLMRFSYHYSTSRGWCKAMQRLWDDKRDRTRFPRDLHWTEAGTLDITRQFRKYGHGYGPGNNYKYMLYFAQHYDGGPMDIAFWREMTTAAVYSAAARHSSLSKSGTIDMADMPAVHDWGRIYRALSTASSTPSSTSLSTVPSTVPAAEFAWLMSHADRTQHVQHRYDQRPSRYFFSTNGTYGRFLFRAVELEIRAHALWVEAQASGALTDEWTPYGNVGDAPPGTLVPASLHREYLAEPLPETLLVRILVVGGTYVPPHDLRELSGACGPEVWREMYSARPFRRWWGSYDRRGHWSCTFTG
jgi:hypothetical protein